MLPTICSAEQKNVWHTFRVWWIPGLNNIIKVTKYSFRKILLVCSDFRAFIPTSGCRYQDADILLNDEGGNLYNNRVCFLVVTFNTDARYK